MLRGKVTLGHPVEIGCFQTKQSSIFEILCDIKLPKINQLTGL